MTLENWDNSMYKMTIDLLTHSIASGIPVALTIVKCWNINHQKHKHTYSHEIHDQNDRSNRCYILYGCDDWYFSIWHVSMSQEFHGQLSNWVGPLCGLKFLFYFVLVKEPQLMGEVDWLRLNSQINKFVSFIQSTQIHASN